MAIQQKVGVPNISLKGSGAGTVFKIDLSLAPFNMDTKGHRPVGVEASVTAPDGPSGLSVTAEIDGDLVTLTFSATFSSNVSVNLVLVFDSK